MHQHTITGEAVVLNLRAANFMPRLGAAMVDAICYFIGWLLLTMAIAQYTELFALDIAAVQAVMILAMVTLVLLIPLVVEGCTKGRSLGKVIFGLRVVRDDGGTIRWRHALIRCLTGVFELWMTVGSVAIIVSLFNGQSKRLGDMMAGTFVIMARAPKLPTRLPDVPPAMQAWAQVADIGRLPIGLVAQVNALIRNAATMNSVALHALSQQLQQQVLHYVTPGAPVNVDALTFLIGVLAERRNRDYAVLTAQRAQRQRNVARLTGVSR